MFWWLNMRDFMGWKLLTTAAVWLLASHSVRAEGFLESVFNLMAHKDPVVVHPTAAPVSPAPITVHRHAAAKADAQTRIEKAEVGPRRKNVAHKTDGPVSEDKKYLSSVSFSGRFRGLSETAQKETQEAIGYLTAHDRTLRRGDVLMTQNGPVVFDPDKGDGGAFVAADDKHVSKPLQKRLACFAEPASSSSSQSVKYASVASSAIRLENQTDRKIQTSDGRTIRFVGGYYSQEAQLSDSNGKLRLTASALATQSIEEDVQRQ